MAITKDQMYRAAEKFSEYRSKPKPKYCAYEDAKKLMAFMMERKLPPYTAFIFLMVQGRFFEPDISLRDFVCRYENFVFGSPYRRDRMEYIHKLLHG